MIAAERALTEKGSAERGARELSACKSLRRVNGSYGTGIQGMVQKGDRWENESGNSDVYLIWVHFTVEVKVGETVKRFAFEAANLIQMPLCNRVKLIPGEP